MDVELFIHRVQMHPDRAQADAEAVSDILVKEPLGKVAEDFLLPFGQALQPGAGLLDKLEVFDDFARHAHGHRRSAGMDLFLDGPTAKARDAVHIVFANEKVRPQEPAMNPDVNDSEPGGLFCVLSLEALVRIKLTVFHDKDKVHVRDLIGVELVDQSWVNRLPSELGARLQSLLETPEG